MPVELQETDGEWTLSLRGVVGIADVFALHAAACEAVRGTPGSVAVRLAELEALDTAATQVLLALVRSLAAVGRAVRFESVPPSIAESWRHAGLRDGLGVGPE